MVVIGRSPLKRDILLNVFCHKNVVSIFDSYIAFAQ